MTINTSQLIGLLSALGVYPPGSASGSGSPVTVSDDSGGDGLAVGDTLSASFAAGWAGSIQWMRNGVAIPGATGASYTLTGADAGADVRPQITDLAYSAPASSVPFPDELGPLTLAGDPVRGSAYGDVVAITIPPVAPGNSLIILVTNTVADTRIDGATRDASAEPLIYSNLAHAFRIENVTDERTTLTLRAFNEAEEPVGTANEWLVFEVEASAVVPASTPVSALMPVNDDVIAQEFTTTYDYAAAFLLASLSNSATPIGVDDWVAQGENTFTPAGYNLNLGPAGTKVTNIALDAERNRSVLVVSYSKPSNPSSP